MKRILALLAAAAVLLSVAGCAGEDERVPEEYYKDLPSSGSRVERITYTSHDYYYDSSREIKKHALVYLPADYSEETPCEVLILCHGLTGTETEWGFTTNNRKGWNLTDHVFAEGSVKNLIIVMPNGRSCWNYDDPTSGNTRVFDLFGQELRNDLIPYIDAHYNTYADREHRAMAGLSIGATQTVNIGLCECLDLFSAFGAFSAAPTSLTSAEIANKLKGFSEDLSIRYFYNLCGTEDGIAYASASAAAKKMPADSRLSEENWCWQERSGEHNFDIWYLGLYNFLKLLGSMQE